MSVLDMDKSNEKLCEYLLNTEIFSKRVPNISALGSDIDLSSIESLMAADDEEEHSDITETHKSDGAQIKNPVTIVAAKEPVKMNAISDSESEGEIKDSNEDSDSDDGNKSVNSVKMAGENGLRMTISFGVNRHADADNKLGGAKDAALTLSRIGGEVKSPGASSVKSTGSSGRSSIGRSPSQKRGRLSSTKSPVTKEKSQSNITAKSSSKVARTSKSSTPKSEGSLKPTKTPPHKGTQQNQGRLISKGERKKKSQKSAAIINMSSSSISDDEFVDVVGPISPFKINGDLKPESPSVTKSKSKPTKISKDSNYKTKPKSSSSEVKDIISSVMMSISHDALEPLLSPISNIHSSADLSQSAMALSPPPLSSPYRTSLSPATQPANTNASSLPMASLSSTVATSNTKTTGLTYLDGKPSIMVQLDLSLIDTLPTKKSSSANITDKPHVDRSPSSPVSVASFADATPVSNPMDTVEKVLSDGECSDSDTDSILVKTGSVKKESRQSTPIHKQDENVVASPSTLAQNKYNNKEVLARILKTQDKELPKMKIPKRKAGSSPSVRDDHKRRPDSPSVREDCKKPRVAHYKSPHRNSPKPTAKDDRKQKE